MFSLLQKLNKEFRWPWSLRNRLVVITVLIVAIESLIIGGVSTLLMRDYLLTRVDAQLEGLVAKTYASLAKNNLTKGAYSYGQVSSVLHENGQRSGTFGAIRSHSRVMYPVFVQELSAKNISGYIGETPPEMLETLSNIPNDGRIHTIDFGNDQGKYRVIALPLNETDAFLLGVSMEEVFDVTAQLARLIQLLMFAGLIATFVVACVLIPFALSPLKRVLVTAEKVSRTPLNDQDVVLSVRINPSDVNDTTEVGKVGKALNRMLDHVGQALDFRSASERKVRQFVSDASHELRTPLASIRGYAELTRRSPHQLPEEITYALARIESESKRMTNLVEDLLLLARLDEGQQMDSSLVDLVEIVHTAFEDAAIAGPSHVWEWVEGVDQADMLGDQARLHQVFLNMFTNARVHTPEGSRVRARVFSADEHLLVVEVSDSGNGIPEEIRQRMFERFVRADASRARHSGSTGLGLALVKAVIDGHGGSIEVVSSDEGTTFRITFQRAQLFIEQT